MWLNVTSHVQVMVMCLFHTTQDSLHKNTPPPLTPDSCELQTLLFSLGNGSPLLYFHLEIICSLSPPTPSSLPPSLRFVTGVIAREPLPVFQRVLWRACRGNVFLRHTQIEEYLEDTASVGVLMEAHNDTHFNILAKHGRMLKY